MGLLNVSAVKAVIHECDKQCSDEYLESLERMVDAQIRRAGNGNEKRLCAESVGVRVKQLTDEDLKIIMESVVQFELQINVIDKTEALKLLRRIKSRCVRPTDSQNAG